MKNLPCANCQLKSEEDFRNIPTQCYYTYLALQILLFKNNNENNIQEQCVKSWQ